ncbi:MAG: Rpn family recombination-promoting nuclease/putative transposase, partial [Planctomycetaceae bacterium]|nr:Rpn family recombination-promoting nuclease/putative transposase [Planctomycetaceae bacterium]
MRYLDPKLDPVFRKIFGEHKQLCRSLLNSILPLQPNQKIVSLTYKPPELPPDLHIFKDSIVDVYCVDNTGRQFIVEMQMYWTESFKQRVLFNSAKAYVRQLKQGGNYKLLKPVYALNFINEIFIKDSPEYYHDYKIVNIENTSEQIEGLELIFIELPKFKPSNRADKKLYDLWLTFLTEIKEDTEYIPPQLLKEKVTNEAINCLKMSSYTKKELEAYDCYWDSISTQKTLIDGKKEEGIEEGIEKGKKEGREEGI